MPYLPLAAAALPFSQSAIARKQREADTAESKPWRPSRPTS